MPHYRYNRYVSQTPSGGVVKTACIRLGITTTWISEFRIDTQKHQMQFQVVKSTLSGTLGMNVLWKFQKLSGGAVRVSISTNLPGNNWPRLSRETAEWILDRFFLRDVSQQSLACLKRKVETRAPLPVLTLPPLETNILV